MHLHYPPASKFVVVAEQIKQASHDELSRFLADYSETNDLYARLAVGLSAARLSAETKKAEYSGFNTSVSAIPLIDVNELRGVVYDPSTRGLSSGERDAMSATLTAAQYSPGPIAVPGYASPYQFSNLAVGMGTPSRTGQLVGLGMAAISNMGRTDRYRLQRTGVLGETMKALVTGLF